MIEDKTEAACRRGDLLVKRQKLMDAWATYCSTKQRGQVIRMDEAAKLRRKSK